MKNKQIMLTWLVSAFLKRHVGGGGGGAMAGK